MASAGTPLVAGGSVEEVVTLAAANEVEGVGVGVGEGAGRVRAL